MSEGVTRRGVVGGIIGLGLGILFGRPSSQPKPAEAGSGSGTPLPEPAITATAVAAEATKTAKENLPDKKIHLYGDPKVNIEQVKIAGIYFVPKGEESAVSSSWKEDMQNVLDRIAKFYTRELRDNSRFRVVIPEKIVFGRKIWAEYSDQTEVEDEIRERVFDRKGDLYEPKLAERLTPDEFQSVMTFRVLKEDYDHSQAKIKDMGGWDGWAIQSAHILPEKHKGDIVTAAHEFGHTLNIMHPWEDLEINLSKDQDFGSSYGNVMGYVFSPGKVSVTWSLEDGFLMTEQKRKLGLIIPETPVNSSAI